MAKRQGPDMLTTFQRTGRSQLADGRTFSERAIYLSCGDSAHTGLPTESVDLVVTDPPVFRQRSLLGARRFLPRLAAIDA